MADECIKQWKEEGLLYEGMKLRLEKVRPAYAPVLNSREFWKGDLDFGFLEGCFLGDVFFCFLFNDIILYMRMKNDPK